MPKLAGELRYIDNVGIRLTPPCAMQVAMVKNETGMKFLKQFEQLCYKVANQINIYNFLFESFTFNARNVNLGEYDSIFAMDVLSKLTENERNEIYKIAQENRQRFHI